MSSEASVRIEHFADGLALRVDMRGSGRPVLVLHGARGPQSVAGFAAALAEQAQVFAPVHPGFGGQMRPEWLTDADDLAIAYLALIERLDLRDVIVVGFSFGGWVAAELAARDQTRLAGLVLVDAAGIQVEGMALTAPSGPPGPPQASQPPRAEAMAVYGRSGFADPTLRRRLARITIPALVAWGENDPVVPPAYGRAYAAALPHARFALIPEAGHMPQLDQPEQLLDVVREFLAGIAAPHAANGRE